MPEYPDYDTFMKKMPPLLPSDSDNEEHLKEFLVAAMWPKIGTLDNPRGSKDPNLGDFLSKVIEEPNNPNGVKRDILSYLVSLDDDAIIAQLGTGGYVMDHKEHEPEIQVSAENVKLMRDTFLNELHKVRLERLSIKKLKDLDESIKRKYGESNKKMSMVASLGILNDEDKAIIKDCRESIAKKGIPFNSDNKSDIQRKSTPMHLLTKLGLGGAIIAVIGLSAVLADKSFTGGEYLSTVKDFGSETIDSMSNMVGGKKKRRKTKRKSTKRKRTERRKSTKRRKSLKRRRTKRRRY